MASAVIRARLAGRPLREEIWSAPINRVRSPVQLLARRISSTADLLDDQDYCARCASDLCDRSDGVPAPVASSADTAYDVKSASPWICLSHARRCRVCRRRSALSRMDNGGYRRPHAPDVPVSVATYGGEREKDRQATELLDARRRAGHGDERQCVRDRCRRAIHRRRGVPGGLSEARFSARCPRQRLRNACPIRRDHG
jgi:hypothetical protein